MGSIGAGYLSAEQLDADVRAVQTLTPRPFSVNLFCPQPDESPRPIGIGARVELELIASELHVAPPNFEPVITDTLAAQVDVVLARRVPIVSVTFGLLPTSLFQLLKSAGCVLVATATSIEEAREIARQDYDMVVVQGYEAGGHRGTFLGPDIPSGIGLLALIPQVVDAIDVPVIAAGGIMDGRGIAAALVLGASAVQMGTAFLTVEEAGTHARWVDTILSSLPRETVLTRTFSGKYARGINNVFIQRMTAHAADLPPYPVLNSITTPIRRAAQALGNVDYMSLWAGQGFPMARRLTAEGLIEQLVSESHSAIASLGPTGE